MTPQLDETDFLLFPFVLSILCFLFFILVFLHGILVKATVLITISSPKGLVINITERGGCKMVWGAPKWKI